MKILVNARFLIPNKLEGIGLYTYEILKRLTEKHREHTFILCIDRPSSKTFQFGSNVVYQLIRPPARHPFLFIYWFERGISRQYVKHQADLFYSPDGFCSLNSQVQKTLLVIHDLAYLHFNKQIGMIMQWYYWYYMPKFLTKADQVITVSMATQTDLIKFFPFSQHKLSVIYNGVRQMENLPSTRSEDSWSKKTNGRPFFIAIGSIHPRKNITGILQAFTAYKQAQENDHVCLLIVGRKAWMTSDVDAIYRTHPFRESIIFTGYLPDHQLFTALKHSLALIYVSFFEGFGLPIIEAMACSVPVITSDRSAMAEIAGSAALLVNPEKPGEISKAMCLLVNQPGLRQELIVKGRAQAEKFDWDKAADKTWSIMQKIYSDGFP